MVRKFINIIKEDILVYCYFVSLLLVLFGLHHYYGNKYIAPITLYISVFISIYFLLKFIFKKVNLDYSHLVEKVSLSEKDLMRTLPIALIVFVLFIIGHLFYLGHVPIITSYLSLDYYNIALIRQSITKIDSSLINYFSAFMLKAIIPFYLLLLLIKDKKLFYFFLIPSVFYALAMMQKSYIVGIFIPCIIYYLVNFDFKKVLVFILIPLAGNYLLVFVTNPELRANKSEIDNYLVANKTEYKIDSTVVAEANLSNKLNIAGDALYQRVFLTTGKIVGYWFDAVPSKLPYAKGCGYHFLAPALGCDYDQYDYSRIIYDSIYIKESKKGLKGTVTVACFMYDYANFGILGLIISAFLLALFLIIIKKIFNNEFAWIVSFNGLFVLWLTSAAISTTLFSGGWGLTILLFLIYKKVLINN